MRLPARNPHARASARGVLRSFAAGFFASSLLENAEGNSCGGSIDLSLRNIHVPPLVPNGNAGTRKQKVSPPPQELTARSLAAEDAAVLVCTRGCGTRVALGF